jgi:hypothetical protein
VADIIEIKPNKKKSKENKYGPKFKPEFQDMLLEHMSKGFSYETFAKKIGTCRQSLYYWEKSIPGWLDTKRKAFEACQYRWEEIGLELCNNPTVWMFQMKARFGWRDVQVVEQSVQINETEKERSVEEIKSRYNEIINERVRALASGPKDNLPE